MDAEELAVAADARTVVERRTRRVDLDRDGCREHYRRHEDKAGEGDHDVEWTLHPGRRATSPSRSRRRRAILPRLKCSSTYWRPLRPRRLARSGSAVSAMTACASCAASPGSVTSPQSADCTRSAPSPRSEEHTSELQSQSNLR